MNSHDTARILAMLHGAYPHIEIDDPVATIWSKAMEADDYDITAQAVSEWIGSQRYWPTVAEMRAIARRLQGRADEHQALPPGEHVADLERAKAAFARGYTQSRSRLGDDLETINRKLEVYLRKFPGSVPGVGS